MFFCDLLPHCLNSKIFGKNACDTFLLFRISFVFSFVSYFEAISNFLQEPEQPKIEQFTLTITTFWSTADLLTVCLAFFLSLLSNRRL